MPEFEETRALLAEKFSKEKKRLKTYGTKVSSFDLANAVSHNVRALCSGARYSELKALTKFVDKFVEDHPAKRLSSFVVKYIDERKQALKTMRDAIHKYADDIESKRPRKPKGEQCSYCGAYNPQPYKGTCPSCPREKKHKKHKKEKKHGSHRSSRSS